MKTAIRRPKIRKPVKGMRMFLKQGMSNIKQAVKSIIQGAQEKARRVRQMACGFIKP